MIRVIRSVGGSVGGRKATRYGKVRARWKSLTTSR